MQEGVTLAAGTICLPRPGKVPTIVMAHGFSAMKEMYLDKFAEVFAAAGLGALVFDNRTSARATASRARKSILGSRSMTTGMRSRSPRHSGDEADRIGIWGSSYSGGHVIVVGAIDRRVKCVAGQVPLISGHNNAGGFVRADFGPAGAHVRRGSAQPLRRKATRDDPRRRRGSDGALRTPDAGFMVMVHRDR